MISSKPSHASLLFVFLSSLSSFNLSCSHIGNNPIFCPEIEKNSLLIFKQSLKDPYDLLSSWDGEVNCCQWHGVICSNSTGHVNELHLQGTYSDEYPFIKGLSGKLNPSLLDLKHLTYLDLSQNSFAQTIPSFLGSFVELEYLSLSYAGFHGKIPHVIGNLSSLHSLNLECDVKLYENGDFRSKLDVDSLEWLSGLSKLEYLNMNYVNLGRATNWAQVINTLPSLKELNLSRCSLEPIAPVHEENSFEGPIQLFCNATKLQHIDLSGNYLNSTIPDCVGNLTSLKQFSLDGNHISGKLPKDIFKLCKLEFLSVPFNNLEGDILDLFGNMSDCFLGALRVLSLRGNQFSGHLTHQFGELKSLEYADLSVNSLSGEIPANLGKLTSLRTLDLSYNKFNGSLPESLGQLFNLKGLSIADNMLEGVVTESHFVNLTNLWDFSASGNNLTLNINPNWVPPFFHLQTLKLRSWNLASLGSQTPLWHGNQTNLIELDLSDTGISFSIPSSFWDIPILNLSHNYLHGEIPYLHGDGQLVYVSSNRFSGLVPRVGGMVTELDLSNNSFTGGISHFLCDTTYETYSLRILHLGGNQLSGELPDCWKRWPLLQYLNLGNNNLSGSIPHSMGYLGQLRSLNVYNNKLSSHLPFSLHNCSALIKINLANNNLDGNIPAWVGTSLIHLMILILRSNKLSGNISSEICFLNSLQILDLSDNKVSGIIPRCVYNFTAMTTKRSLVDYYDWISPFDYAFTVGSFIDSASVATKGGQLQYDTILYLVTNIDLSKNNLSGDIPEELASLVELRSLKLSENQLTGVIPDGIGDMKQLESLDLSMNSLSGQIPNTLTLLSSLAYLNLSFNKLTGKIPEGTQISGFNGSSFIGNNLCGPPLTRNCSNGSTNRADHENESEGDCKGEIEWSYVFLSLGYAVGFSAICTALALKKSWRDAYFGWLGCMWDKVYVFVYIKWIRLTKPSAPNS